MEFNNSFTVRAPLDVVWNFLLNVPEVTDCVPGAQMTEQVDDTHYKGTVRIKLGAVQMSYRGEVEIRPNDADHTITLIAKGSDTRGGGGASGTITSTLTSDEPGVTTVNINSRVDVTGRVAQFGRGIMQDVAGRLIRDFAGCLERKIEARMAQQPGAEAAGSAGQTGAPTGTEPAAGAQGSQPGESGSRTGGSAAGAAVPLRPRPAPQPAAASGSENPATPSTGSEGSGPESTPRGTVSNETLAPSTSTVAAEPGGGSVPAPSSVSTAASSSATSGGQTGVEASGVNRTPSFGSASFPGSTPAGTESSASAFRGGTEASAPGTALGRPTGQTVSSSDQGGSAGEISMTQILVEIVRSRIAEALRDLAKRIEPR